MCGGGLVASQPIHQSTPSYSNPGMVVSVTFTYVLEDLATDNRTRVRFLTRDTVSPGYNSDEEIDWLLSEESSLYEAAAMAAEAIVAKFSGTRSKTVGDLTIASGADQVSAYKDLARILRARAMRSSPPIPYAGGISVADKQANADDESIVQAAFGIGSMDYDSNRSDWDRLDGRP